MLTQIDHLGIAVKSLSEAIPFYESTLGLRCEGQEEVPSQKVKVAFFLVGNVRLELLEPTASDSPIAKFLETRGEGIHHIAFSTDNILAQLQQAASTGCRLINERPVEGAHEKQVAFLHPKSTHGMLVEFCAPAPKQGGGE